MLLLHVYHMLLLAFVMFAQADFVMLFCILCHAILCCCWLVGSSLLKALLLLRVT